MMQFCDKHWTNLRQAIDDRCLTSLVATSFEESIRKFVNSEFDPLMLAHNMILLEMVKTAGVAVILIDACPLCIICECDEHGGHPEAAQKWIDGASDAVLRHARIEKLVPEAS